MNERTPVNALLRTSLLAAAAFFATAALAQPKPALVRDVDQPARAKYQQTIVRTAADCGGLSGCSFVFGAVPAGMRLVVTWVNLHYSLDSATDFSEIFLKPLDGDQPWAWFSPTPDPYFGNRRNVQAPVTLYFEATEVPVLRINGQMQGASDAYGTLAGYLVSLP